MPEPEAQRKRLMYFIALLATRVPSTRSIVDNAIDKMNRQLLRVVTATPERWAEIQQGMRKKGLATDISYERAKELVTSLDFRFQGTQNWQVHMMFYCAEAIFPSLMARTWSVAFSPAGRFICSDRPVVLQFTKPMPPMYNPGFEVSNTEVILPLSRHIILCGAWNSQSVSVSLTCRVIAYCNTRILRHAERYVFSAIPDFVWLDKNHSVRTDFPGLTVAGSRKQRA